MSILLYFLIAAFCVGADQAVKYWAATDLIARPGGTWDIWDGVFHLTYVENRGAAFGIFQGARTFFIVLTCLFAAALIVYLLWKKPKAFPGIPLALILGGAIGNLIDRIAHGYVVDMFYVKLIDFAVFNLADAFLCIGVALMAVWALFFMEKEIDAAKKKRPNATSSENVNTGDVENAPETSEPQQKNSDRNAVPEKTQTNAGPENTQAAKPDSQAK